ncbi:preprotein translocase subunit YajC [Cerasicoccus maritimus]|uniref:preprotein translocase subunit YajC n=1 Tax=Cerasicoccus maritimus TaxID=490089 RepID=UPI00285272BE|nr:preprotein translocase subunit YajC [Cerasicoccus maritimus]
MLETPTFASILTLLAQTEGAPGGFELKGLLIPILFVAGFWFLLIAPQRKMQKQHDKMVTELKNGDEVMTKGGVYGTIVNVKTDRLTIRVANNTNIELSKPFIQTVVKKKGEPEKTEEKK